MQRFRVATVVIVDVEDDNKTAEEVRQAFVAEGMEEANSGAKCMIEAPDGINLDYVTSEMIDVTVQKV
jgi:hypothetical protein